MTPSLSCLVEDIGKPKFLIAMLQGSSTSKEDYSTPTVFPDVRDEEESDHTVIYSVFNVF